MAARDIRAAKRYAAALFGIAQKQNSVDAIETDLESLLQLMQDTPVLLQTWESPLLPGGRKRDLIKKVFGNSFTPLTMSFLNLLIDKGREEILEAVQHEIRALADTAKHLVRAEATFAVTPTPEEQSSLVRSLEQRTGEHVNLTVHLDPAILGGVVVRMQDTIIDGSVRGTLERLREQLLQEA